MRRNKPTGSAILILGCGALLASATVGAATITGTAKNDTLRGGAAADKLAGKAGNDRLYGAAGNDVLAGGTGNDLLVGGSGADTLACGAGRDTARGDAQDKIARDCEVVKGVPAPQPPAPPTPPPPPPPPAPPPAAPVTPGSYQGQTQNGHFLWFQVSAARTITAFELIESPAPCGVTGEWKGEYYYPTASIGDDGSFAAEGTWDGSYVEGDIEWTHWDARLEGRFDTATSIAGTIVMNYGFKHKGNPLRCSSDEVSWSASLQS